MEGKSKLHFVRWLKVCVPMANGRNETMIQTLGAKA